MRLSTSVENSASLGLEGSLPCEALPGADDWSDRAFCNAGSGSFLTSGSLATRLKAFLAGRMSGMS